MAKSKQKNKGIVIDKARDWNNSLSYYRCTYHGLDDKKSLDKKSLDDDGILQKKELTKPGSLLCYVSSYDVHAYEQKTGHIIFIKKGEMVMYLNSTYDSVVGYGFHKFLHNKMGKIVFVPWGGHFNAGKSFNEALKSFGNIFDHFLPAAMAKETKA